MKLTTDLYLLLLDGRPRPMAELLPFLESRVPPEKAARYYTKTMEGQARRHGYRHGDHPLEHQVAHGRRRIVRNSVHHLAARGFLSVAKPEGPKPRMETWTVGLTGQGMARARDFRRNGPGHCVWKELKRLYAQGRVDVTITWKDAAGRGEFSPA